MISMIPLFIAETNSALIDDRGLSLGAVVLGVVLLAAVIFVVRRLLVATPAVVAVTPVLVPALVVAEGPSNETLAIIAACVAVSFGKNARITSVRPAGQSIEMFVQQWSLEGRRQIYSSHQVR